ncbi:hypothetical protein RN001_006188 [Aquatica leii]|uniref:CCHC-type domain-containing protein n=1 Tax=Aquatica leii TaxID=1421715 RepID=A0AAN7SJM3_9COLE|nr:hypothetical protein RN001_006188 [Aquatica leii]
MSISLELAEKMLIRFDGAKTKLNEFLDNSEKAMELVSNQDKLVLLKIIETKITDNARVLIRNKQFNNWSELKVLLLDIYADRRTQGQWQLKLSSCRQNYKESVIQYANRVDESGKKACLRKRKDIGEDDGAALPAMPGGGSTLNPPLLIRALRPKTLQKAISTALAEEQQPQSSLEIRKYQNARQGMFCSICKKTNHESSQCYFKQHNVNTSNKVQVRTISNNSLYNSHSNYNQSQVSNNSVKICKYCKKSGHLIAECRKRAYNNRCRQNLSQPTQVHNQTNDNNSSDNQVQPFVQHLNLQPSQHEAEARDSQLQANFQ